MRVRDLTRQSDQFLSQAQRVDKDEFGLSIFFTYRFINFEWKPEKNAFQPIRFDCALTYEELRSKFMAPERLASNEVRSMQRLKFGNCEVEVPHKNCCSILIQEVLNPFYLFQIWSLSLWIYEEYYYFSICIFVVSTGSIILTLVETMSNNRRIREMARYSCQIRRLGSNGTTQEISSPELVPGDVIEVPENSSLPCDLILLSGTAIVNEAMLTGESVPVMKTSLPLVSAGIYSDKGSEKHILFGGTQVV